MFCKHLDSLSSFYIPLELAAWGGDCTSWWLQPFGLWVPLLCTRIFYRKSPLRSLREKSEREVREREKSDFSLTRAGLSRSSSQHSLDRLVREKASIGGVPQGSVCLWHINWAEEVTPLCIFLRIKFTAQPDKDVASKTLAVYRKRQSCLQQEKGFE